MKQSFLLHDDFIAKELFLTVLYCPTQGLHLLVVEHEAHPPPRHDLLLADTGGGHGSGPATLCSARVGVVSYLIEGVNGYA